MYPLSIRDLLGYGDGNGPEDDSPSSILSSLSALNVACMAEILLFGVHVVLFAVCIFCMLRNRPSKQKVFLLAIICMFGLSIADVTFSFRVMIGDFRLLFQDKKNILIAHVYPKSPIFVSNNFIADMLLLYRCYMIWNRNKYVAISSSILLIADTVWGWIGAGSPIFSVSARFAPVYYWTVFGTNIIMTAATAGRIYYLAHMAHPILGDASIRRYHVAIAILVESGLVYSCCLLALVLTFGNPNLRIIFACITIRMVAIMPTLMIVQVQLGRSVDEYTKASKGEDLEMRTSRGLGRTTTVRLDTIITTNRDPSIESGIQYSAQGPCEAVHTCPDLVGESMDSNSDRDKKDIRQ